MINTSVKVERGGNGTQTVVAFSFFMTKQQFDSFQAEVVKVTQYTSINKAKRANRGNLTSAPAKPTYAAVVLQVGPL
jgi:hypothetical protein